jgi:hypothetical protein
MNDFYKFDRRHVSRAWSFTLDTTLTQLDRWRVESRLRHSRTFDPNDSLEDRIWLGTLRTFYLFSPDTFLSVFVQGRSDQSLVGTQRAFLISSVFGWESHAAAAFSLPSTTRGTTAPAPIASTIRPLYSNLYGQSTFNGSLQI